MVGNLYQIICIIFSDLEQSNFQKTDMIIIDMDIAITKSNLIISEIEIAYVYDLAHAWCWVSPYEFFKLQIVSWGC